MPEKNTKFDTRLDQRNQKRKKNNILNILIGIVLLLIIIVTVNIVTNDDDKESANSPNVSSSQEEENKENESVAEEEDVDESVEEADTNTESTESSSSNEDVAAETEEDASDDAEETETETEAGTVTTEASNDPNVESVIIDSGWQPIGTTQTGEHVSSYTKNTVDWDEKVKALAYAANLDSSNMYVPFIGNGGSPQKSIGTVTSKDRSEIYRIYLEWVDGEGWKPTKKEKLKALK